MRGNPPPMTDTPSDDLAHHRTGRARRAFTGVLWSGIDSLIPAVSSLVVFLLVSRALAPEQFGYVAFALAIVTTIGAFSPAGFGDALVQRDELDPAHVNATFWMCSLWGLGLYLMTALAARPVSAWLGEPMLAVLLPVIGLRIIFELLTVVPTALLSRRMQFRQIALRTTLASLGAMATCLVVLYLGFGLWALVMSQIVSSATICLVSWLAVDWRPKLSFERRAVRDLRSFGSYASGSHMITVVNIEQILVGALLGSQALGIYYFARRIFQLMNQVLTGALGSVSYPLLSSLQAEKEKLKVAYLTVTFMSSVVAFPIFAGLALVAGDAVPLLFGAQWVHSVAALRGFCAIGLLSCIGILQATLFRSQGRADWWMWYQVGQQFLTALTILVLARYGVTVVVLGIAIKTWLTFPFVSLLVGRLIDMSPGRYGRQFLPPLFGCLVMAAAILALREWVSLSPAPRLVAEILLGALTYVLTMLAISGRRLLAIRDVIRPGK